MIDFFRDPVWQFVGALLAVIAIAISIVLFFAQRKRKKLSYEILSKTAILSATEEISGKIQISFQGEPVKNVYLVVVKLCNSGNLPITTGDYESPIIVKFENSQRILSAEVSETSPSNLPATLLTTDKTVQLMPILLNPGDTVVTKTLISGYENDIEVAGRIVGVRNIEKHVESLGWDGIFLIMSVVLLFLGLALGNFGSANNPISGVLFISSLLFSVVGQLLLRRRA